MNIYVLIVYSFLFTYTPSTNRVTLLNLFKQLWLISCCVGSELGALKEFNEALFMYITSNS